MSWRDNTPAQPTIWVHLGIVVDLGTAMLSLVGHIVVGMLSKRQLQELALYSPEHIARLERAGRFPKRVRLGPNRVGLVEEGVLDWLQARLECREATQATLPLGGSARQVNLGPRSATASTTRQELATNRIVSFY